MSRQIQLAILVAAAIVLSGGGFVAGMTVGGGSKADGAAGKADAAASKADAAAAASGGRRTFVTGPGAGAQGQQVSGRVLSVGDGSITVEVRQPGSDQARSVIALVGGNARVVRSSETEIKASDIKVGDQVIVVGQPDSATGAVSANAVVVGLNALQQLFGGGADRSGGPAPSGSGAPRRATPSPSPTR